MKVILMFTAWFIVASCAGQPETSLGDSPIRDVRCPSFLVDEQCLARARRDCGTESVTVISAPQQGDQTGQGQTVPIEGRIEYRTITVRCEE